MNTQIMPAYYKAKLAADETLTVLGKEREGFGYVVLRPGGLSDEQETGKVQFGRTEAKGMVTRGDVAEVGVRLLEREGVKGWYDLLGGDEGAEEAVERVLKDGVDSMEGEDLGVMKADM